MINWTYHLIKSPGLVFIHFAKSEFFLFSQAEETPIVFRNTFESSSISSSRGSSAMKARDSRMTAKAVALSLLACFASKDFKSDSSSGIVLNHLCNFHDCTSGDNDLHYSTRNRKEYLVI